MGDGGRREHNDNGRQDGGAIMMGGIEIRWTAAAAMGNGDAIGGRTVGRQRQGREMGRVKSIFSMLMREIFHIHRDS